MAPYGADPVNGVLVAAVAAAAAAARAGAAIEMWLPHAWPVAGFEHLRARLDEAGVQCLVLDREGIPKPLLRRSALGRARQREVDVVHLHSVFSPHVAQLALVVRGRYLVSPHGGYSPAALERSRVRKRAAMATVERLVLRRAAAVVALTGTEEEHLRRWSGSTPVVVVPNGVDPPPPVDRGALRRELGVPPGMRLAVFAGRLDRAHKGLDELVAGLAGAPGWFLALVGPDDRGDRALLAGQAASLGVTNRCAFLGIRQGAQLHEALAGGDVFVLPSRWEGLPLVLLEALGHGVPAVVSPAVEAAVPVSRRGAGWVCAPGRVAEALRAVASTDAQELGRRGAAALALTRDYRWPAVGAELARVYANVAAA